MGIVHCSGDIGLNWGQYTVVGWYTVVGTAHSVWPAYFLLGQVILLEQYTVVDDSI